MKHVLLVLLVACGSSQPAPQPTVTTTEQAQTTKPESTTPAARPQIGETCGDKDACADGLTCVSYYGIAGPRGPQFKSCEIKCTTTADCPTGHECITIADGPGRVCRSPS